MGRRDNHISPAQAAWAAASARAAQRPRTRSQQPDLTESTKVIELRTSIEDCKQVVSGTPILDLPPELLHLVFEYLDKPAIFAARISCSIFAKIGVEHILDSIRVVYKRESLQGLSEVSNNLEIARCVKSLCFQADRFAHPLDFEQWNKEREDLRPWSEYNIYHELPVGQLHSIDSPQSRRAFENAHKRFVRKKKGKHGTGEVQKAFDTYCAVVADQANITKERLDYECFKNIFSACANLQDVTVSISHGTSGYLDAGRKAFKEAMTHPYGDIYAKEQGVHQFWTVVEALHAAKRHPRRIFIGDVSYRILTPTWRESPVKPLVESLTTNLRELRIGFCLYDYDRMADEPGSLDPTVREESAAYYKRGLLAKWLATATQLRMLKLRMWHKDFADPYAVMADVLGNTTWPKLRELGLSEFSTSENFLVDLLLRHKSSLRRLSLSDIYLSEGAWESVFERLGGKLQKLRKVKIRRNLGAPFGEGFDFGDGDNGASDNPINGERDAFEHQLLHGGDILDRWLENDGEIPDEDYEPPTRIDEPDAGYTTDGSEVSYGSDDFDQTI